MLFRESFITDKGAELLARATAQGGQIVWTTTKTSNCNTDGDSASTMNHMTDIVKTEQDSYTSSGSVTNAIVLPPSATDDGSQSSAAIFCELTNETYDGLARTFGAWAKIQGDQTDVLAIVARCGTGVTPTYINPVSEGLVKAFVDFTLKVSAEQAQAVQSAEGYYATATALNTEVYAREQATSRMVTTHSATSTTDGDDQTILGTKTFSSGIVANGGVSATTVSASGNATIGGTLAVTGYTTLSYLNTAEIVPKINSTSDDTGWALGSSTHRWKEIIVRNGNFSGALSVAGGSSFTSDISVTGDLTVSGDINVISGNVDVTYGNIEADVGDTHYLKIKNGSDSILYVDVTGIHVSDKLYIEDASSISPSESSGSLTVPIGSIIAIYAHDIAAPTPGNTGKYAGESLAVSESSIHTSCANGDGTFASGYRFITAGTYRLLSDITYDSNNGWGPFALVQRIL